MASLRGDDMADEFDEGLDTSIWHGGPKAEGHETDRASAPRLYRAADAPMRARLLTCMLRPLGTLSLVAVAAGAFAVFLDRTRPREISVTLDDVARFSNEQVFELARFVEQVSPEAMRQAAGLLSENAFGLAAFSASVALLLYRRLRPGSTAVPLPVAITTTEAPLPRAPDRLGSAGPLRDTDRPAPPTQ